MISAKCKPSFKGTLIFLISSFPHSTSLEINHKTQEVGLLEHPAHVSKSELDPRLLKNLKLAEELRSRLNMRYTNLPKCLDDTSTIKMNFSVISPGRVSTS